jgi:hypothetical protein
MSTRPYICHMSCASLDRRHLRCTSMYSVAGAYSCIRNRPLSQHSFSARWPPIFASRTRSHMITPKAPHPCLKRKQKEGINLLNVVTLHNIGPLERESTTGCGWIACMWYFQRAFIHLVIVSPALSIGTTDASFLERPQYYDLVIDMTFSPKRASHPNLQLSVKESNGRSRRPSYHLSIVRFT